MRREVNIAGKALSRHYWAINREIEQEGRFVTINRSVDHFAVIRLRWKSISATRQ